MGTDDREVIELRRRIAALTDEARKNEEAWQRSHRREMELLEADSLATLFERLTDGLSGSYRLASVTLALVDPDDLGVGLARDGRRALRHEVDPADVARLLVLERLGAARAAEGRHARPR